MSEVSLAPEGRKFWALRLKRPAFPCLPYWTRRLLQAVPVVLLVITVNFFLLRLAPGDMADVMAGESGVVSMEHIEQLRRSFGTEQPVLVQYAHYLGRVLSFDLGWSYRNGQPVATR